MNQRWYWGIVAVVTIIALTAVWWFWRQTMRELKTIVTDADTTAALVTRLHGATPRINRDSVKGIYLTATSAASPKKLDEMIALIDRTELNGVVIDIKDYRGLILYDSQVPLARELGLVRDELGDVSAIIKKLHSHGIYVMARQTVFQDPILAEKKPEWALKHTASGGLWRDDKGLAWVDAANKDVWRYNRDIAAEAMTFGFDEINFDYVRFPSDGNLQTVVFTHAPKKKYEVMGEYYRYLGQEFTGTRVPISVDLFGYVMERRGEDDLQIGQRLVDAVDHVDFVSPMMYPSHYPAGHLGLSNPAAEPGLVIDNGMQKGVPLFVNTRSKVRPWLQAFNIGAVYDAGRIRAQIDAVEKYQNAGWLLWNARNVYTDAGLKIVTSSRL